MVREGGGGGGGIVHELFLSKTNFPAPEVIPSRIRNGECSCFDD